jgi:alpha-galactosidase
MAMHEGRGIALIAQTRQAATYDVPHIRFAGLDDDARYRVALLPPYCEKAKAQLSQAHTYAEGVVLSGRALRLAGISLPLLYPETAWLVSIERGAHG